VLVTHSFYSEWDYSSTMEQTRFRLGARVNYYEKFKKAVVEPRLSFYRKLGDYLGMEILAEVKNQTSTQVIDFQTDFLGIEKRRWILSDDLDIPIISSKQFSVGVQYQKNGYLLSWEGYFKQVNDVISSSQGFLNQFQYIRTIGDFHVRGIDVLANKKFDRSTTWVNYAWAKNTFEFPELIPPDFPHNLDVTHTLNLGSSYEYRQMEFSTGITYRSGMPYTPLDSVPIVENRLNYDLPNSRRMHYYLRADMSWTYHFLLGEKAKAMVGMSVWNLLNRQNVYATYFQLTGQSKVETIRRKALGITPNLTFRISF
ncbi:MAG: TonB-dependent receptor, partial [Cyclobacteriaceae bacterium]|nr:TonB-dependent receptor [Cyclobacteriaceae bacterium]